MSTWTPPPPCQIDVMGEYTGNPFPEQREYRVTLVAETEDEWRITTETADGTRLDSMRLLADEAQQVRKASATAMRWPVPGLQCSPRWWLTLEAPEHTVILDAGSLDEVSGWLEFWLGETEWNPDDEEWAW